MNHKSGRGAVWLSESNQTSCHNSYYKSFSIIKHLLPFLTNTLAKGMACLDFLKENSGAEVNNDFQQHLLLGAGAGAGYQGFSTLTGLLSPLSFNSEQSLHH